MRMGKREYVPDVVPESVALPESGGHDFRGINGGKQ